ncbi:MAG TPA: hypothetical protein VF157_14210, partial [Chloroflexota bacterium]
LAGDLAAHLLPFMLDPRGANIMTRGPSLEPATSFRLNSTTDGSVWRVTVGPKGRQVDADPGQPAEVEVRAEPGWLALALYGRLSAESSHLNVSGLDDGRQRFQAAFGA